MYDFSTISAHLAVQINLVVVVVVVVVVVAVVVVVGPTWRV